MCVNNLPKVATQWNSGATRDSNRGHRARIPIALTTKPLRHTCELLDTKCTDTESPRLTSRSETPLWLTRVCVLATLHQPPHSVDALQPPSHHADVTHSEYTHTHTHTHSGGMSACCTVGTDSPLYLRTTWCHIKAVWLSGIASCNASNSAYSYTICRRVVCHLSITFMSPA